MSQFEKKIKIGNFYYKYLEFGNGNKTIIFLHSAFVNKESMQNTMQPFYEHYRCIAIDLPAHNGIENYDFRTVKEYGNYICNFIQHFRFKKIFLFGFSLGGMVSLECADILKYSEIKAGIAAWASPLLSDPGLTYNCKILISLCENTPDFVYKFITKKENIQFLSSITHMTLGNEEARALSGINKVNATFISEVVKNWIYTPISASPKIFVFSPDDALVTINNYYCIEQAQRSNEAVFLIKGGGHFGTKEGYEKALGIISDFIKDFFGAEGGI